MSKSSSDYVQLAVVGVASVVTYQLGVQGRLGPDLQNVMMSIRNSFRQAFGKTTSTTTGGTPAAGAVSPADIANWAAGIQIPVCIGQNFVKDFGRLPANIPELNGWGDKKQYHHPDGTWTCG